MTREKSFLSLTCLQEFLDDVQQLIKDFGLKLYIYGFNSNRFDTVFLERILIERYGKEVAFKGKLSDIKDLKVANMCFRDMC